MVLVGCGGFSREVVDFFEFFELLVNVFEKEALNFLDGQQLVFIETLFSKKKYAVIIQLL